MYQNHIAHVDFIHHVDVNACTSNMKRFSQAWIAHLSLTALRLLLWLTLSSGVVLFNKWLLQPTRFPFPITLTWWHMAMSAFIGTLAIKTGFVNSQQLTWKTFSCCTCFWQYGIYVLDSGIHANAEGQYAYICLSSGLLAKN